jgi:putative NADPH-quinone reductase
MKTLIITAHPSSHGLTHGIASVLESDRLSRGGEVEVLDLYKSPTQQPFLNFENIRELKTTKDVEEMQKKISWADELIFIHPLWWMSMPAIMKNFLDQNLTPRFAYRYIEGKRIGLLENRVSRVYVTCDGPRWGYFLMGFPFFLSWICGTLAFCGIMVNKCILIRNRNFKDDTERANYLDKLQKTSFKKSWITRFISFLVIKSGL